MLLPYHRPNSEVSVTQGFVLEHLCVCEIRPAVVRSRTKTRVTTRKSVCVTPVLPVSRTLNIPVL